MFLECDGIDANCEKDGGWTPLLRAAHRGWKDAVRFLAGDGGAALDRVSARARIAHERVARRAGDGIRVG